MQESNTEDLYYELEQSHESLKFALQSARMCSWEVDLKTNLAHCCPEMLELWGIPKESFTGDRTELQKKVHPDDLESMRSKLDFSIKNHSVYDLIYRINPRPGKTLWVRSRGRCIYDKDSVTPIKLAGIVYDVTPDRYRDQFLMIASHELRTPLTSLSLQLEILEMELKENFPEAIKNKMVDASLQKQRTQIERVKKIVNNIFEYIRTEDQGILLKRTQTDLLPLIDEVIKRFRLVSAYQDSELKVSIGETSIIGFWDLNQLEQVLVNILLNAFRYGKGKPIGLAVSVHEKNVTIKVTDHGPGITPGLEEKIFEKFAGASHESYQSGLGIGLYLAKKVVEAHNGTLTFKSVPGVETEFQVLLPLN